MVIIHQTWKWSQAAFRLGPSSQWAAGRRRGAALSLVTVSFQFPSKKSLWVSLKSECRNNCKSVNYTGTIGGGGWTESRDPMPIVNVSPNGPLCDPGTRSVTNNRDKKLKLETGLASFISPTPQSLKTNLKLSGKFEVSWICFIARLENFAHFWSFVWQSISLLSNCKVHFNLDGQACKLFLQRERELNFIPCIPN